MVKRAPLRGVRVSDVEERVEISLRARRPTADCRRGARVVRPWSATSYSRSPSAVCPSACRSRTSHLFRRACRASCSRGRSLVRSALRAKTPRPTSPRACRDCPLELFLQPLIKCPPALPSKPREAHQLRTSSVPSPSTRSTLHHHQLATKPTPAAEPKSRPTQASTAFRDRTLFAPPIL